VAEADGRLAMLRANGPTPQSFTFRTVFPAPDGRPVRVEDDWFCPA
jgi:hypothetical protein